MQKIQHAMLVLAVVGGIGCQSAEDKVFAPKLAQYNSLKPSMLPRVYPHTTFRRSYLRRKVVLIDRSTGKLDESFAQLPADLKAKDPSEVKSVVFVTWKEVSAGMGTQGKTAFYRVDGSVSAVDVSGSSPVWSCNAEYMERQPDEAQVMGKAPTIGSGTKVVGAKPVKELVEFLQALPQDGSAPPTRSDF